MPTIKVEKNISLFYKDHGSGQPVIFVHGWCINSDSWEYMADDICNAGFRCITYDQRGCGRSDQPWDGYNAHRLAADLASIINQLDLSELILIGHSSGCAVITQYLTEYGEGRVARAVYMSTISPSPTADADMIEQVIGIIKADRPAYIRSLANNFYDLTAESNTVSKEMTDWTIGIVEQASLRAAMEMTKIYLDNDQREALKKINIPILLQHGDRDINAPVENTAKPIHELLKNSTLKVYAGQPHGMYICNAGMFSKDIIDFIKQL